MNFHGALFIFIVLLVSPSFNNAQASFPGRDLVMRGVNAISQPFGYQPYQDESSETIQDLKSESIAQEPSQVENSGEPGIEETSRAAESPAEQDENTSRAAVTAAESTGSAEGTGERSVGSAGVLAGASPIVGRYLPLIKSLIPENEAKNLQFGVDHILPYVQLIKPYIYKIKNSKATGKAVAMKKAIVSGPLLAGAVGFKLGALVPMTIPMGIGAAVGAPVGAIMGAKVGAMKGAMVGKAIFAKKVALGAAAGKVAAKYAVMPIFMFKKVYETGKAKALGHGPNYAKAISVPVNLGQKVIAAPINYGSKVLAPAALLIPVGPKSIEASLRVNHPWVGNQYGRIHLESANYGNVKTSSSSLLNKSPVDGRQETKNKTN